MRDSLRSIVEPVCMVLVLPVVMLYRAGLVAYDTAGTWLSMIPGFPGIFIRRAWYAHTLSRCGRALAVQYQAVISNPDTEVGDNCYVGHFTRVALSTLGDDVMIAEHCAIVAGGAQYGFMRRDVPMRLQPGVQTRVSIGDDVWVGAMCMISSDVAAHSIVAGGAVVNRRFEEWEIISGTPAEPVATRPAIRRPRRKRPVPPEATPDMSPDVPSAESGQPTGEPPAGPAA